MRKTHITFTETGIMLVASIIVSGAGMALTHGDLHLICFGALVASICVLGASLIVETFDMGDDDE